MMDRQTGDHAVEPRILERQTFRVAALERDVVEPGLGAARPGPVEHLLGGVEGNHGGCARRDRGGDHAGSAGDVEEVAVAGVAQRGGEARRDLLVGLFGEQVERLRLPGEFVGDALQVVHGAVLAVRGAAGLRITAARAARRRAA